MESRTYFWVPLKTVATLHLRRILAGAALAQQEAQAQIVFCRFSGPAADCLLVSGFSRLLEVADSIEEATLRLQPGRLAVPGERLHARGTAG